MHSGFFLKHTRAPLYGDKDTQLAKLLKQKVSKFTGKWADFDPIVHAMGDAKVVMIGEETHGTHEFYHTRAELTKRLITENGFNVVAVEADWPDAYRINRFVCGRSSDKTAREALGDFERFPRWMWRNTVVEEFVTWLRAFNDQKQTMEEKVRFYGLDMYSMFRSADAVIEYLEKVDKKDAELARQRYGTLNRYRDKEHQYAQEVLLNLAPAREKEVVAMLVHMLAKGEDYLKAGGDFIDGDELFFAQENARVVKDAEAYYRNSFSGGSTTWNLRDKHMFDTLQALFDFREKKKQTPSRVAIWAHNSHLGDARATEYARERDEWNLGQLVRDGLGLSKSFNVGLTTYTGTVTAASRWGGNAQKFDVTPAFEDSYEAIFHHSLPENWLTIARSNTQEIRPDAEVNKLLSDTRTERMIGVQYVKHAERASHYVPAVLPQQFDSVIHIDVSRALQPLDTD